MALKLMYITNEENIALVAEQSGVDWIFIDLEINGKEERQGHLDTVISRHSINDVKKVKKVLTNSKLLVRVNPIYNHSKEEIDRVIKDGADIVMLPFFKYREEVEDFIKFVNGRVETCLLLETPEAVDDIDSILEVKGIDKIHIGLNDLHLGYNMKFMFEPLADGTVDRLSKKFKKKGISFGFGGIAQLGQGTLPAENIIKEHYRLGSSMVILSRSFCRLNDVIDFDEIRGIFNSGVKRIRDFEKNLENKPNGYFLDNHKIVESKVAEIVGMVNSI
jgi:2-keto-3-deoxy-L-rhamnonate aldolase RhmA